MGFRYLVWFGCRRGLLVLGCYRLELPERENQDRAYLDLADASGGKARRGLGAALLRHTAARAALSAALSDAPQDAGEAPEVWDAQRVHELNGRRPHYGTRGYSVAAERGGRATGKLAALTEVVLDLADAGLGHQAITA